MTRDKHEMMESFQGLVQASKDRLQFGAIKAKESGPRPTADERSTLPSPISFVIDSFPSWTPMWSMIPSYFLDPFVGNFLVKKVEGTDGMTCDKHKIIGSFQGSFERVWSYKSQGKWSKTYHQQ
ncbi:hypothetical protein M9H77_34416 [Catharanthus roseus]|uniref:Uncharacterized protein n=1 Tax=Catharanthus roseus TaxID=4058 RepID=A0ACB9ZL50_CATRO|nr:hypothetical protein M9H77_34416 [Catharanthus roseus]